MVKKSFLILLVFLVGCTTDQARRLEQILGVFRMLGYYEIDIDSREKQTIVVEKPRRESFWGRTSEGRTHWAVSLCFDRGKVDNDQDTMMELPRLFELPIWVSMTMGGELYYEKVRSEHAGSTLCWWLDERNESYRQGWYIAGGFLPMNADFSSPMIVEVQILDDKDSVLKKYAEKYSNLHVMVTTGY